MASNAEAGGKGMQQPNGYISDFYMKKNTSSDASNKVGMQLGNIQP